MSFFIYDEGKDQANQRKHGVSFEQAKSAFMDPRSLILHDLAHSGSEKRYYCLGTVDGSILTVRFTWRDGKIRIIGAGYWRKGKKRYEEENNL